MDTRDKLPDRLGPGLGAPYRHGGLGIHLPRQSLHRGQLLGAEHGRFGHVRGGKDFLRQRRVGLSGKSEYQVGRLGKRHDDRNHQRQRRHHRRLHHRPGTYRLHGNGNRLWRRPCHLRRPLPRGQHDLLRPAGQQYLSRVNGRDLCHGTRRQQQIEQLPEQLRALYRCQERLPQLRGMVQRFRRRPGLRGQQD